MGHAMSTQVDHKGKRMIGLESGEVIVGGISGIVALLTTALTLFASRKKNRAANEATLQSIALEQSEHAFASIRSDVDRYRQEVDRLRSDNDRLTRLSDDMVGRLRQIEAELMDERAARRLAEQRVDELMRQIAQAGVAPAPTTVTTTVTTGPALP